MVRSVSWAPAKLYAHRFLAFPCWDEPLLKATYSVTMISRADTVSLSNMPSVSEEAFDFGMCYEILAR